MGGQTTHSEVCSLIEWDQVALLRGDSPGHLVLCFVDLCMTWVPIARWLNGPHEGK